MYARCNKKNLLSSYWLLLLLSSSDLSAIDRQQRPLILKKLAVTETADTKRIFHDSPFSGNVFVLQDLDDHGIDTIQEVAKDVPNFSFAAAGSRSFHSILGMRGLTNTPFFSDPAVVLYVDDIPYGHTFSHSNLVYGMDKTEVYRGPQGTLFGKNSYGGVLNVYSRKPGNQLNTHVSGRYGRFDSWLGTASVDGALIPDTLFFSLAGAYARSDGYLRNDFLGTTPDQENHLSGRAQLSWQAGSDWDISLIANGDDFKDASPHLVSTRSKKPFTIRSDENGRLEQSAQTQALRIRYKREGSEFLAVTSHRDWRLEPLFLDLDFTPAPLLTATINKRQTQWNQEFRLGGKNADLAWTVGSFISLGRNESSGSRNVRGVPVVLYSGSIDDDNYAVFGHLTLNLTEAWRIHTGLRLDYIDKSIDRTINTAPHLNTSRDFFHVSPKLSIDYLLDDDVLLYASTGLAFKPGGFAVVARHADQAEFDSESMWASELGVKSQWLDDRIQTNLAFFYYQIDDYQVERLATPVDYTIVNAPEVTSYGLELETEIELMPGLQLETAFGLTHLRFDTFIDPLTKLDLSGNSPPYVPEKSVKIAGQYQHPAGYFVRGEWLWNDKIHFDDFNSQALTEDDYAILNARLGYRGKHFSLYLFGDNLTDTRYNTFLLPFRAAAPARPRSLGVRIDIDY